MKKMGVVVVRERVMGPGIRSLAHTVMGKTAMSTEADHAFGRCPAYECGVPGGAGCPFSATMW